MRTKKIDSICKNCKHFEFHEQDFGLCHYLEDIMTRAYGESKKNIAKAEKEFAKDGIQIRIMVYDEKKEALNINGVEYVPKPIEHNPERGFKLLDLEEEFELNTGVQLCIRVKEGFGCNKFKKGEHKETPLNRQWESRK